jgi:hypothetical protein
MKFIFEENQNPGSGNWKIDKIIPASGPEENNEMEGFASTVSVFPGETIRFYVRCGEPAFAMDFYRMGWYGGLGGRLMLSVPEVNSVAQVPPILDSRNMVECHWSVSYELTVPADWCTGVFLCKLSSGPGPSESYIVFVVKALKGSAQSSAPFLFQHSCNTYQAYNTWGSFSLYEALLSKAPDPFVDRSRAVSYNRPYIEGCGSGQFFRWEFQLIRWMERNGIALSYCSNIDLHADQEVLSNSQAFLSVGHDEYWSKEMYDLLEKNVENKELGVAFLGANPIYWQVRFEEAFNGPNRTMVCYKCDRNTLWKEDPMYSTNPALITAMFRDFHINRPEQKLIGQMYLGWLAKNEPNQELTFGSASHWLFENTGIESGEKFPGLIGYEFDRTWEGFPKPHNLITLAKSPVKWHRNIHDYGKGFSNVTIYTKKNGNTIFSAGTCSWCWGIDDYGHEQEGLVSEKIQRLTLNVLNFVSKKEVRTVDLSIEEQETVVLPVMTDKEAGHGEISTTHLARYTWWIGGIAGLVIGLKDKNGLSAFMGFVIGSVVGRLIGVLIDRRKIS